MFSLFLYCNAPETGAKDNWKHPINMPPRISSLPQNQERHALQVLLSGNWKPATALYPTQGGTLAKMIEKGWIERRRSVQFEYKITEAGREAFRARLPERISKKTRYRE